ncbi:hypothetical protein JCGZ_02857 [Jatropha curcas]|uniref:Uncharacterized protein n=1 Tax=Jatropha curcas TaxID=180498 RepID=A0A067JGS5_JATCU|nr:hypothetical protein JCGZ_02857 [Jatropha curcas]
MVVSKHDVMHFGRPGGHSEKFTESMPIWYLKCPENCEGCRTGPGIFFGCTELPKRPLERKASKSAGHGGGSGRRQRRQLPPSVAAEAALQPGFSL